MILGVEIMNMDKLKNGKFFGLDFNNRYCEHKMYNGVHD